MYGQTPKLTPRQEEVKARLDRGMEVREIAKDLGISTNAVHQQIQRLRRYGVLPRDFTASGRQPREIEYNVGAQALESLLANTADDAGERAAILELSRISEDLEIIQRRIGAVLSR